jgi:RNA recognition motif-containing protein
MNIYVGNLPHQTTEQQLLDLFKTYGNVSSAKIITDHFTGASRGFAFVEMDNNEGSTAIESLNGTDFGGRPLVVNEARPRTEGGSGGGGGRSSGGGGNSYRGGNGSSGYNSRGGNSGGGGGKRW